MELDRKVLHEFRYKMVLQIGTLVRCRGTPGGLLGALTRVRVFMSTLCRPITCSVRYVHPNESRLLQIKLRYRYEGNPVSGKIGVLYNREIRTGSCTGLLTINNCH